MGQMLQVRPISMRWVLILRCAILALPVSERTLPPFFPRWYGPGHLKRSRADAVGWRCSDAINPWDATPVRHRSTTSRPELKLD